MNTIDLPKTTNISPILKEEFRSLNTSIEFSGGDNHVICITSSFPNAGKSYVAFNLANVIAEDNKKVVLIDADMRNSTLYSKLGFEKEMTGLSHVLSKKCAPKDALYATSNQNLYIMPTGIFSNNPTALLRSNAFKVLLERLLQIVDYIIVDTPPLQMVTDAAIIANACDASLLVVPEKEEKRKTARNSVEILKAANENFLGIVLNKHEHHQSGYGRYGYGKYGYGYGKYGK